MKVLILTELHGEQLTDTARELLGLPAPEGTLREAVVWGEQGQAAASQGLIELGASVVHTVEQPGLDGATTEVLADALAQVIGAVQPDWVVGAHTPLGRDLMPRLAARCDAALVTDCTQITCAEGDLQVRRPVYAGKASAGVEFVAPGLRMLTIRPRTLKAPQADSSLTGTVQAAPVSLGEAKTVLLERVQAESKRPDVTEAALVVSGGRSLKSADNFQIIEALADQLGAAVGASRAAVDAGYRPYRDQVGQTGKVVSPQVYIACGISGAIQHLAGMRTSKHIIAINSDREAPIFQLADYGLVGDLFEIVPAVTEALRGRAS